MAQRYRTLADYFSERNARRRFKNKRSLAKQLHVSESYVSLIVAGKRQPSLDVALRIEQLTGVPAASLLAQEVA